MLVIIWIVTFSILTFAAQQDCLKSSPDACKAAGCTWLPNRPKQLPWCYKETSEPGKNFTMPEIHNFEHL